MGIGLLGRFLALLFMLELSIAQEPNTDGYFVSNFLKILLPSSSKYDFSKPVCSWRGVSCDSQEHVTKLLLPSLGLSGLIPDNTIGKLALLQYLDLSSNMITGLSNDFWSLGSTLKNLNLSRNQISGSLTNNLGNFGLLEMLDLSWNGYSGVLPQSISSLSSLQVLHLNGNSFEGEIPHGIVNCRNLERVDLSSNRLNGTIPANFGAALENLAELNLAKNKLSGNISGISGLKSLTRLNLSDNSFVGSMKGVFQLTKQVLDLSKNQFDGHISDVQLSSRFNWSGLEFLDLSQNQLGGEIALDWNGSQSLQHLNIAQNRFSLSQRNFQEIGRLSSLSYLNMSGNNLQGSIPDEITRLPRLKTLDLSVNNLTGEFPSKLLQKLPQMETYNFSYNSFTLCASELPPTTFRASFFGSQQDCPIAAHPGQAKFKSKHRVLKLVLALIFSFLCLTIGLLCLALGCRRRSTLWTAVKQAPHNEEQTLSGPFSFQTDSTTWVADVKSATSVPVIIFDKPLLNFTFADLLSVTSHFDRGTLLAEGRFGPVYRGCLPGGTHIAVKVLVHGSTMTDEEAARELEHLGRIKHPNLVPLIGYCLAGDQRIAIYEYMDNGNLHKLLHDLPLGAPLDCTGDTWEESCNGELGEDIMVSSHGDTTWAFRHRIALGTARALAFLHHGCFPGIIHRDVKASSVYLGPELEPRLSDFGLSKIFGSELADELTRAAPGYSPPELAGVEGMAAATSKGDVYGFGVVLFELMTGKKPLGDEYPDEKSDTLVSWVRGLLRKGQGARAIDPKICDTGLEEQMVEALRIGFLCTADLPSKRPDMHQIVGLLKDIEPGRNSN